jgi:hypothetical protein
MHANFWSENLKEIHHWGDKMYIMVLTEASVCVFDSSGSGQGSVSGSYEHNKEVHRFITGGILLAR